MAHEENAPDAAEAARHARFGTLPERITPAEMVEEKPASTVDPARNNFNDDEWLIRMGAF